MRNRLIVAHIALCAAVLLSGPLSAQFIGYTSPQTITQKVFSGQTTAAVSPNSSTTPCTPTDGNPCAITNIGQSVHSIQYTTGGTVTQILIRVLGSYDGVTAYQISEDATIIGSGMAVAFGYYPFVSVQIVTLTGTSPTVTINYTGTTTPNSPYGQQLYTLSWRHLSNFIDATVNQTPTSNSNSTIGGLLVVKFGTATCATSTIAVTYGTPAGGSNSLLASTTLAANTKPQFFCLPTVPASSATFSYTAGGCNAGAKLSMALGVYNAVQMIGGSSYAANNLAAPQIAKVDSSGSQYVSVVAPAAGVDVNIKDVAGTATVTGGVAGSLGVGGLVGNGLAPTGNPIDLAWDATVVRRIRTDTLGILLTQGTTADGSILSSQNGFLIEGSDGTRGRNVKVLSSGELSVNNALVAGTVTSTGNGVTGAGVQRTVAANDDPCQSSGVAKSSVPINITSAATTALVAVSGSTTVYVCGFSFTISEVVTTANTIQFEQGTGAACVGAPTALTGLYGAGGVTAGDPVPINAGGGSTVFKTAASNGLCAVTAIGASGSFQGVLTYVQQ